MAMRCRSELLRFADVKAAVSSSTRKDNAIVIAWIQKSDRWQPARPATSPRRFGMAVGEMQYLNWSAAEERRTLIDNSSPASTFSCSTPTSQTETDVTKAADTTNPAKKCTRRHAKKRRAIG